MSRFRVTVGFFTWPVFFRGFGDHVKPKSPIVGDIMACMVGVAQKDWVVGNVSSLGSRKGSN